VPRNIQPFRTALLVMARGMRPRYSAAGGHRLDYCGTRDKGKKKYVQLKVFDDKNVQRVIKSDTATSSMGVPQGATLGPFSSVYHNCLPYSVC
jgi:hypothetical protein